MKVNTVTLFWAAAVALFAVNPAAIAKCSKSALVGTWGGAITVVNVPASSNNYSSNCEVRITKAGNMSMVGSCTAVSSNPSINGVVDTLTAEGLTVDKDCSVHGTVTSSLGGTSTLNGRLNSAKNVFVASFINTTNGVGLMSFVK